MSTTLQDIPKAIEPLIKSTLLALVSPLLAADIVFPNVLYQPTPGVAYARVDHLHARASRATAGVGGLMRRPGLTQVSLFYPQGEGSAKALAAAQAIADAFKSGTALTVNSTTVQVQAAYLTPALRDAEWFMIPVTIDWNVYAAD